MLRVRALKPYYYRGREYAPGSEFEMDERERTQAELLRDVCGVLEILPDAAAAPARHTTAITEQQIAKPQGEVPEETKAPPRRRFVRARNEADK